jgi:hypothetical protein
MILAFKLSMPSNNSWNGKWSGDGQVYAQTRTVRKVPLPLASALAGREEARFSYAFGDGWVAAVAVTKVSGREATKLRRETRGFCGYDWMIDSIIAHGRIQIGRGASA